MLFFIITFFGCKGDEIITGSGTIIPDEAFNWSAITPVNSPVFDFEVADADNLFVRTFSRGYKITNGAATQINFKDSTFTPIAVAALNKDYAVFSGFPTDIGSKIKIYDNGIIRSYDISTSSDFYTCFHLNSKDDFLLGSSSSPHYIHFLNGIIMQKVLPDSVWFHSFGNSNGNLYLFTVPFPPFGVEYNIYKITGDNAQIVRSDLFLDSRYYFLNKDIIRVQKIDTTHKFSYFTENSWIDFYTYNSHNRNEDIYYLSGESRNFFFAGYN